MCRKAVEDKGIVGGLDVEDFAWPAGVPLVAISTGLVEEESARVKTKISCMTTLTNGQFKYYVIKEVGGWGQKMVIFDDLQ